MARTKQKGELIEHALRRACDDIDNNESRKSYIRGVENFSRYCAEVIGIKRTTALPSTREDWFSFIQQYSNHLKTTNHGKKEKPYTASTIKTYVTGVLHSVNNMYNFDLTRREFDLPLRRRSTKSREIEANRQGKLEAYRERNERLIEAANALGLRRSEYSRLRGRDLCRDESGYLCVEVKGKGGKVHKQRILGIDTPVVNALFQNLKPKEKVFARKDLSNKIDLHAIRRRHAQKSYDYYLYRIETDPAYEAKLKRELVARWDAAHPTEKASDAKARERYIQEMFGVYKCRGSVAASMREHNRPVVYHKLALMAVSVFHLSHWRNDVTVRNYMI